jgi:hypothetical protein
MDSERRHFLRYPFIASAVVTEPESGARLELRTSDLSYMGCYLDTINALPLGTSLRIEISHRDQVLAGRAVVVHIETNMGMGVEFKELDPNCVKVLEGWIRALANEAG